MKYFAMAIFWLMSAGWAVGQVEFYGKDIPPAIKNSTLAAVMSGSETYKASLKQALENNWKYSAVEFIDESTFEQYKSDPAYSFLYLTLGEANGLPTDFFTLAIGNKKKGDQPLIVKQLIVDKEKISTDGAPMVELYVKNIQQYVKAVESGDITDRTFSERFISKGTYRVKDMPILVREKDFDTTLDTPEKRSEYFKGEIEIADQNRINDAVLEEDNAAVVDIILTGDRRDMYSYKRIYDAATGALLYRTDTEALHGKKQGLIEADMKSLAKAR